MLIGELSEHTGASTSALRYYEQRQLLESDRDSNGYRRYGSDAVLRVHQIRALIGAGFTCDVIARLLPCAAGNPPKIELCPSVAADMRSVLRDLEAKLGELDRQRQAIGHLLVDASD